MSHRSDDEKLAYVEKRLEEIQKARRRLKQWWLLGDLLAAVRFLRGK